MALTVALLGAATFNTTGGNTTVVATPTLGDMIVIVAAQTGMVAASLADNNTDGHGNYTSIVSALKSTSADQLSAWVRADTIQKAVSTTFTATQTASTGGGLAVFRITGATISGAAFIRQSGSQANQASGTPATPLGTGAALTTNALIAAFLDTTNAAPTLTVPAGFAASDVNTNYNTPTTGFQITHANSGVTASTITWGTAAPSAFCDIAFEMRADAGQTSLFPQRGGEALDISLADSPKMQAVKKSVWCFGDKWARRRSGVLVPA